MRIFAFAISIFLLFAPRLNALELGIDRLLLPPHDKLILGKRIGLITNQTGVTSSFMLTSEIFEAWHKDKKLKLIALFSPEHGLYGEHYDGESVASSKTRSGIPIYSLHSSTRRPTDAMLKNIDLLVFDIQDVGTRSYTFASTLFYVMEEAAKLKIPVIVCDRPNPINGIVVDGPIMQDSLRSFIGYINVPLCHGMTIGELARYFNQEYKIGCNLQVIEMHGWKRTMSFKETGLTWIPSSPNIPEATTPLYYPITGILGEFQLVSIGIGYTLPFRLVGAPWIDANKLANQLNAKQLPGIFFSPMHFRPFYGRFAKQECHGVLIHVTNPRSYRPYMSLCLIAATLRDLYPNEMRSALQKLGSRKSYIAQAIGNPDLLGVIENQKSPYEPLLLLFPWKQKSQFLEKRKKYLLPSYSN